jgi:thioredoxin-related protein
MFRMNRGLMAGVLPFLACLFAVFSTVRAEESIWTTDFEAAKAKAKEEKKLLFVYFTGSDWCTWCKRLDKEVFDEEKFKTETQKSYIMVELDYPHNKKLPLALETQNHMLQDHYKIHGWPTIIITDTEGKPIARTGYRAGGPEKYLEHLDEFAKIYDEILQLKSTLGTAQGLERAKLLDQILEAYVKLNNDADEAPGWSAEIIAIDSDNKAGLKVKYEIRILMAEASGLRSERKFEEAKLAFDKVIAHPGLSAEQKKNALVGQAECFLATKDYMGFVACLKKAVDEDPDDPRIEGLKRALQTYGPMAEKQEAIVKLKAELKNTEGLDRAKLLDKLVGAQEELVPPTMPIMMVGGAGGVKVPPMLTGMPTGVIDSDSIAKWSKEIVALDADNKAELKHKYEYRGLLAEADICQRQQKSDEAETILDKALALPNLTEEQKQNTLFLKGNIYMFARDIQNSVDCYKKALAASPEGKYATVISTRINALERALERTRAEESDVMNDEATPSKTETTAKKGDSAPSKVETNAKKDESAPKKIESDAKKDVSVPKKADSEAKKAESDGKKESASKPNRKLRPRQVLASI